MTCLFTLLDKPRSVSSGSVASAPVQFGQDIFVSIAQMAEQRIFNPLGAGSIPAACTKTEDSETAAAQFYDFTTANITVKILRFAQNDRGITRFSSW